MANVIERKKTRIEIKNNLMYIRVLAEKLIREIDETNSYKAEEEIKSQYIVNQLTEIEENVTRIKSYTKMEIVNGSLKDEGEGEAYESKVKKIIAKHKAGFGSADGFEAVIRCAYHITVERTGEVCLLIISDDFFAPKESTWVIYNPSTGEEITSGFVLTAKKTKTIIRRIRTGNDEVVASYYNFQNCKA